MILKQGMERLLDQLKAEIHKRLPVDLGDTVAEFANQCYADLNLADFNGRELSDICGSTLGSWGFIQNHNLAMPKVRVFNPEHQQHGWQLGHTVVAILARNRPFITDSIRGELNRRTLTIHTIHSNTLAIIRDSDHQLLELLPARSGMKTPGSSRHCEEVLLYLEIGRCTDSEELSDIVIALQDILNEVAVVVDDFDAMSKRGRDIVDDIANISVLSEFQRSETQSFINWLCNDNFTFLGYEKLAVSQCEGELNISKVAGSELGLLRHRSTFGQFDLHNEISAASDPKQLLDNHVVFSKSSVRSRVHRQVYPDYVAIKRFDAEGDIIGEYRFMGLYASQVYTLSPSLIPLIRHKVREVLDRSGLVLESHVGKDLVRLLEVFPRDELFQSHVDELFTTTMAVNQIQERRQVRLFVRHGCHKKFVNCLVYTPRDIYHTGLRVKLQTLLCDAFGAEESEFTTYFSESILTRTHFVLRVNPSNKIDVDIQALEEEVVKVTMSWKDHLTKYLLEEFGEEQGAELTHSYSEAFSPGYMDDFEPRTAIYDIRKIATLNNGDDIAMSFYRKLDDSSILCFRLFHRDRPLALSDVMPILEHLGLRVESEHPYGIKRRDGQRIWIHEFRLTFGLGTSIDFDKVGNFFQEAFLRIWKGDAESDCFNKLILGARLGWRHIAMLRAYARYMKQIQFNFSGEYIAETLSNHLNITGKIVELFDSRFDSRFNSDQQGGDEARQQHEIALEEAIIETLDDVENLSEDRIIRHYLALIKATLRTNYFQRDSNGQLKNYFSFKLSPSLIPDMPLPVPMFEIFIYSPRVEGVHLRGGKVARGGLRWSDRMEDFRTEVLGLVKAQQVKNAVIVPTGAKGGFVAKQLPTTGGREAMQEEGVSCYKIFIQGLLDVTDNLKEGEVIPPQDVVRKDEDDTYLVVAADKGTATFSDIANA
ncbi:MAG: NAD-glutamate dehydrogenase domain-containing protein, partial [Pseudomonadales bacterium]